MLMREIDTVTDALSSATVTSFYNIMVNEVQSAHAEKMENLTRNLKRAEAEKAEILGNTAKVIASLTELNAQREGEFSSL